MFVPKQSSFWMDVLSYQKWPFSIKENKKYQAPPVSLILQREAEYVAATYFQSG